MPTIYIDGKAIEAREGQVIIEAALENGIEIPHFCWHPALSAPANCRICLVKVGMPRRNPDGSVVMDDEGNPVIQYLPKLQPSCRYPVSDGLHVQFDVPEVTEAQHAVMEFLLINHPLDCPICDEAGECKLQEYAYFYSRGKSRFVEEKNHKPKHVIWGPNVIFDAERCIACSRCIRYADEVVNDPVIDFVDRGDHVTIELFPGTQFDNPYSMNVIELCPVGALTSRDFRFKARVWEMSFTPSICPGCSRGCNMYVGVMQNQILRLQPRTNMAVNHYWMCDEGRLTQYPFVNDNRIDQPLLRTEDGKLVEVQWEQAVEAFYQRLTAVPSEKVGILVSGRLSNEELFALRRFVQKYLPKAQLLPLVIEDPTFADDFLRRKDRRPNTRGMQVILDELLSKDSLTEFQRKVQSGAISVVWVVGEDIEAILGEEGRRIIESAETLLVAASNYSATTQIADVVLSLATYAEQEGTYTNEDGRVQHFLPALVTAERPYRWGMKVSRWDKMGAWNDRWSQGPKRHCRSLWQILDAVAQYGGEMWEYRRASQVFAELARSIEAFAKMTYALLDQRGGIVLGKVDESETPQFHYDSHRLKPESEAFRYYQYYAEAEQWW